MVSLDHGQQEWTLKLLRKLIFLKTNILVMRKQLFLDIYNLGNWLDDEAGQIYDAGYLGVTKNLDASYDAASGTWTYSNFDPDIYSYRNGSRFVSVYKMQLDLN